MNRQNRLALPLVLPNDCTWDEQTKTYKKKTGIGRTSLTVMPKALDQLRKITEPVCVVSVAGPQRKGKSYVLSKVFDQGEVFPLGHSMTPETMGIWLWVVPQKFKDSTGRDFTVVLLDSEGSDTPNAKQEDDYGISTLSVLLSSILIYNSTGVANRSDLENLDFIVKLSQRIQLHAEEDKTTDEDEKHFHETLPIFIWLLRDVLLRLPKGCNTTKDYFLKKILNADGEAGLSAEALQAAENILNFFSDFDAFSLPSPSCDPEVVQNLNDQSLEDQVNPKFLEGIQGFKAILHPKLAPKKSINEEEFVTGEALATMVEQFVKALNTPGAVPNVECAWDTFVRKKCTDTLEKAVDIYKQEMTSRVKDKIPCEADVIREEHEESVDIGLATFRVETFALSTKNVDKYLTEFRKKTTTILKDWIQENKCRTAVHCKDLIQRLKREILDPVLAQLRGPDAARMKFQDLVKACEKIEEKYNSVACGAKDEKARVIMDFIPELQREMLHYRDVLERMKDYDEKVETEKANKIIAEEQQRRYEEMLAVMKEDKKNMEIQMEAMKEKQKEDIRRMGQVYEQKAKEQQMQMENMMKAHFEERRRERQQYIEQQRNIQQRIQDIERANAATSREKAEKEEEIKRSSGPGIMDILVPIASTVGGALLGVATKVCSVM